MRANFYLGLIAFVCLVGAANADDRFDGSTSISGEGEVFVLPDVSLLSVTYKFSCWSDSKKVSDEANKLKKALVDKMNEYVKPKTRDKVIAPGTNLFEENLTIVKHRDNPVTGKPETVQLPDPDCTKKRGASEKITLRLTSDFVKRAKLMLENDKLTGFEEVAKVRNDVVDIIGKFVNGEKQDGVTASLSVNYALSDAFRRHARNLARREADKDYELQYKERKKFCGWLEARKVNVSYRDNGFAFPQGAAGYAKKDLTSEAAPISGQSLAVDETKVSATVTVSIKYASKLEHCEAD